MLVSSLPHSTRWSHAKDGPKTLYDNQRASLVPLAGAIAQAHLEVDQGVSSTKKRRKGFGSKVDVPRNRSVVSHYVVNATALGLGGNRAADTAVFMNMTLGSLKPLVNADFRGNEAAPVKAMLSLIGSNLPLIESAVSRCRGQLATAATIVPRTGYHGSAELTAAIAKVDTYLTESEKMLGKAKPANPQQMSQQLKVRAK